MLDSSFYQGDLSNGYEENNENRCVVQRCYTRAEYRCTICSKRYCDEHFRIHGHLDNYEDLR